MARWQPDAEDRLKRAAIELFVERGYDAVTVTHIAERAGLTRRSFFRYFPDKREVLFAGSERLAPEIERRLTSAGGGAPTVADVWRVLADAGAMLLAQRGAERLRQQQRSELIAATPELQERDHAKTADIAAAIASAFTHHGVPDSDATLLGAVSAQAFRSAYERALTDESGGFEDYLSDAFDVVHSFLEPRSHR